MCFIYVAQKCARRSDRKSGKWLEGREKSGNFVMKIEWHPCVSRAISARVIKPGFCKDLEL